MGPLHTFSCISFPGIQSFKYLFWFGAFLPPGDASKEGLLVPIPRRQHLRSVMDAEHSHLLGILEVLEELREHSEHMCWTW